MHQPGSGRRSESRGETTASTIGTDLTSGGAGVKGSWVNLGSATSFAYEALTLCLGMNSAAGDVLLDIGISDGSNRYVLCADLHFASAKLTGEQTAQIYVPVHVASGAQLSARVSGSANMSLVAVGHEGGLGGAPGFSRCVALFTPASDRGIAVDPGGTANTKGSWAQMTASCPNDIGAMFGLIGYNGDTTRAAGATALIDIGIGSAGNEFVLYPNAGVGWSTVRDGPSNCPRIPLFAADVPAGTRIAARAACSINTAGDRTVDLALYGLVK